MPITAKLIIFMVLNIAGLVWLILKLIRLGRRPEEACYLTWCRLIVGGRKSEMKGEDLPDGAVILGKTWRFMLGLTLFCWITRPGVSYLGFLLIAFHFGWYWLGRAGAPLSEDRVIELNAQWGVIYLAVRPDSYLTAKTLSELDLRKKNLLVLAIERQKQTIPFPKGLEVLLPGDRLVMFGDLNYYRGLD